VAQATHTENVVNFGWHYYWDKQVHALTDKHSLQCSYLEKHR